MPVLQSKTSEDCCKRHIIYALCNSQKPVKKIHNRLSVSGKTARKELNSAIGDGFLAVVVHICQQTPYTYDRNGHLGLLLIKAKGYKVKFF